MSEFVSEDNAWLLVGKLAVETTGWDEHAVEATVERITTSWRDEFAALEAIEQIVLNWDAPRRPPWAVISGAYKDASRRRILERPAITTGDGNLPTHAEGRAIAGRAYVRQCSLDGREPKQATLDWLLGSIGGHDGR